MNHIMAGIVLFNADLDRLLLEVKSIYHQVDLICLYDNGSNNTDHIKTKTSEMDKVVMISNSANHGIGVASNRICNYAKENGFQWVLILDHDTICPSNLVETYVKYIDNDSIGMMCPNVVDKEIVRNKWYSANKENTTYVDRCIQSATLIRISAWEICQGFNEWMFIDFVDFDFCKRLTLANFKILKCNEIIIDHQLGERTATKYAALFKFIYKKTNIKTFKYLTYKNVFSSARIYYSTRNNIAYIKIYSDNIKKIYEYKQFMSRVLHRIIRSENRIMVLKETYRGVIDGLKYNPPRYKSQK